MIKPITEIVYPDRGGYTGISICIWKTDKKSLEGCYLESPWGTADREAQNINANYVLEARFFVFGRLLGKLVVGKERFDEINKIGCDLFHNWKPLMDEVISKEERLWKEPGKRGIHLDEIVDNQLRETIKTLGRE